jgi:nitrate reductase delta subunit
MTGLSTHQEICRQFAALCCYPDAGLPQQAGACQQQLRQVRPEAAAALQPFIDFVSDSPETQVEELYTGTFDLQASCHPYVGYLLCGESQQRTLFLMKLQEIYREQDYQAIGELPDHLSEMLRFIGISNDQHCRRELVDDGLLPALEKLIPAIERDDHPYKALFVALQSFLSDGQSKGADPC